VMSPANEKLHLYRLIGQSIMAGRGELPAEKPAPNSRILVLNKSNQWAAAADPLHFDKTSAGVGLGMSFAKSMLESQTDSSVSIGLIPCAVGGTPLHRWQKEGDLYVQAVARARIAMENGVLRGIL